MGVQGQAATGEVALDFTVKVEANVDPVPTEAELQDAYAEMFGVDSSQVSITIIQLTRRRLASRRLQTGAQVIAEVKDSDATKINQVYAQSQALTADTLADTLSDGGTSYIVSDVSNQELIAEVQIVQTVADETDAVAKKESLEATVLANEDAAVIAAGATALAGVTTTGTGLATSFPSNAPTLTPAPTGAASTLAPTTISPTTDDYEPNNLGVAVVWVSLIALLGTGALLAVTIRNRLREKARKAAEKEVKEGVVGELPLVEVSIVPTSGGQYHVDDKE
jgi:hypothetical protein